MSRLPGRYPLNVDKEPSSADIAQNVDRMLNTGSVDIGRSPVTGGYGSGSRTPTGIIQNTPGERFANPSAHLEGSRPMAMPSGDRNPHDMSGRQPVDSSGAVATMYARPGLAGLIPSGGAADHFSDSGWTPAADDPQGPSMYSPPASSSGFYGEFDFPEQNCMVLPEDDHPASAASMQQLHMEMDALLANSGSSKLSAEQQMTLRQNEIHNRAQMEAFRTPVTASIDRVMQRQDPRMQDPSMRPPGAPPPRKPDDYDQGILGFKCFRACT